MCDYDLTRFSHVDQSRLLWLPEGFDPRDHLDAKLRPYDDLVRILVDRLVNVGIWRKRNRWLAWSYNRMSEHFGSNRTWDNVRPGFLASGLIERHEFFKAGSQSMRYRLSDKWNAKPMIPWKIDRPRLVSKVDAIRGNDRSDWKPVHYRLLSDLRRVRLTESAQSVIAAFADTKRWHSTMIVDMIQAPDHRLKPDGFGRVHTLITAMPKPLRHQLLIDDQPTVEIDVCCCQLLLIGLLVLNQVNYNDWEISGESREEEKRERTPSSSLPPIMTPQSGHLYPDINVHNLDLIDFVDACSTGIGYETIAEVTGMPYVTPEERRRLKSNVCHLIFGETPRRGRQYSRQWMAFRDHWPTIAAAIDDLRRDDYRNVAHTLQQFESDLMINGVCGLLAIERPDIPLLTVHDSIITTVNHAELVRERIGEVWERHGRRPRLKTA